MCLRRCARPHLGPSRFRHAAGCVCCRLLAWQSATRGVAASAFRVANWSIVAELGRPGVKRLRQKRTQPVRGANRLAQLTCSCSHADAHACPHARARPSLSFRATAAASGSWRTCSAPSCQRPLAPALYGRPTAARTAVCRAADATARPGDQTPLDQPFCGARRKSTRWGGVWGGLFLGAGASIENKNPRKKNT